MPERSSDTTGRRRAGAVGRAARSIVLIAVVVVLLAELTVRALEPRLPEPLTWYHPVAQIKVEQMDAMVERGETAEVAFIGTSQMAEGALPLRYRDRVATHPTTYNAALLAGYPAATHRYALEEVVPRLHPKTVIYGVASADLEPGPEAPYDSGLATEPGVLGALDRWASAHSALVRHRQDLRDPTVVSYALTGGDGGGQLPFYRETALDVAGGWKAPTHPRCETGEDPAAATPAAVRAFAPDPDREARVWTTIEDLRAQGIQVVVAVVPFAPCFFARSDPGDADATGRARLAAEGARRGIRVIDVTPQLRDDALFSDPGHLNEAGARRFTDLLADAMGG